MLQILRPLPVNQLRLLVFDLDGTLIDSRQDLAKSVNLMLNSVGRPHQPEEQIATYIGDGAGMLVRRALSEGADSILDEVLFERGIALFLDFYREHKLDHTYVYDGVVDALRRVGTSPEGHARKMAVLTNKPIGPSEQICEALGLSPFFIQIYGGNSFATKKPDPEGLLTLIREAGVRPEETVMIGDTDVDVFTARAAGAHSVGCRYGLSPHTIAAVEAAGTVNAVVDTPREWITVIGSLPPTGSDV